MMAVWSCGLRSALATATSVGGPRRFIHHHRERINLERFLGIRRSHQRKSRRHFDRATAIERVRKVVKVTLPDMQRLGKRETMEPHELRVEMLKQGLDPFMVESGMEAMPRHWNERQVSYLSTSGQIFDQYKPQLEDKKARAKSLTDRQGWESTLTDAVEGVRGRKTARIKKRLKQLDEAYSESAFLDEARETFVEAHKALERRDAGELHRRVTEHAFPVRPSGGGGGGGGGDATLAQIMWRSIRRRSLRWQLTEWLEPPRVVQVRTAGADLGAEFGQITVRLHSRQKLAVFDQFGHLIQGSEDTAIDCLEFVVFERLLEYASGRWRIHAKIPISNRERFVYLRTYRRALVEEDDKSSDESVPPLHAQLPRPAASTPPSQLSPLQPPTKPHE